jgi:hypothetical protein
MSLSIAKAAFFVISNSTALFDPDFPDFTIETLAHTVAEGDDLPKLVCRKSTETLVRAVVRQVRAARREQRCNHIAIICHADSYWESLKAGLELELSDLDFSVLIERGQRLDPQHKFTVLAKPEYIGGQEFEAVICVGLESGKVPKVTGTAVQLDEALSQQALRDIYLSFSRARQILRIVNELGSAPSPILQQAVDEGYIEIMAS